MEPASWMSTAMLVAMYVFPVVMAVYGAVFLAVLEAEQSRTTRNNMGTLNTKPPAPRDFPIPPPLPLQVIGKDPPPEWSMTIVQLLCWPVTVLGWAVLGAYRFVTEVMSTGDRDEAGMRALKEATEDAAILSRNAEAKEARHNKAAVEDALRDKEQEEIIRDIVRGASLSQEDAGERFDVSRMGEIFRSQCERSLACKRHIRPEPSCGACSAIRQPARRLEDLLTQEVESIIGTPTKTPEPQPPPVRVIRERHTSAIRDIVREAGLSQASLELMFDELPEPPPITDHPLEGTGR